MDIIQEAINFYKKHRQQFIADYNGQHLIIRGTELIGVYKTNSQACEAALVSLTAGTYIIEHPLQLKRN